jgi:hypothetical protein
LFFVILVALHAGAVGDTRITVIFVLERRQLLRSSFPAWPRRRGGQMNWQGIAATRQDTRTPTARLAREPAPNWPFCAAWP